MYSFKITPSESKIEVFFNLVPSFCSFSGNYPDINFLKWNHFAVTYNGKGLIEIYVNGKLVGSKNCPNSFIDDGDGYLNVTAYNALIDNFRIYDTGLLSSQIKKLYAEEAKEKGIVIDNNF